LRIHHYPGWRLKVLHQSVKELEQVLKTHGEELARFYHIPIPKQTDLPISYNIAPSHKVLTIHFNPETQLRSLDALQWGLIPLWAKDPKIAYRTINARAETVDKAPSFRRAFAKRRCLIPADGFYMAIANGSFDCVVLRHS
jgi:putative SOS response-associated peptidase YedK